jgi:hypothetical protein
MFLMSNLDDKIRARAYEIAERAAFAGNPDDYWNLAEREVQADVVAEQPPCPASTLRSNATAQQFPGFPVVEAPCGRSLNEAVASHIHQSIGLFALAGVQSVVSALQRWRALRFTTVRAIPRV